MKSSRRLGVFTWLCTVVLVSVMTVALSRRERAEHTQSITVFSPAQRGIRIVIPQVPSAEERRAAQMLQATFARAANRAAGDFPIENARSPAPRVAVFVGRIREEGSFLGARRRPPFDNAVGYLVRRGGLFIESERRAGIEAAAAWFLERELGAQWFMPGPLGEQVPRRDELVLSSRKETTEPGFVHRDLGMPSDEERIWYGRNRLGARFEHSHNLVNIFRPDDFRRTPEMAPLRIGQRHIPTSPGDQEWQPNFLSDAAVRHAAKVAQTAFNADPRRLSFSLSTNDAIRYDESEETLAAVSPPRYFRHRPDYSAPVFQFTNRVAQIVGRSHPDRYLPAYAYYWCENTPPFAIERNVVPFLTADRSQWSHPEFAAEDKALIERWCRSGAEFVGVYDYFYGMPFFVPRPTLFAVAESIPFHHRAGVRAFYAETSPNWALDGPKPWLAAQLLWSPEKSSDALLETYYRDFWAEAAAPMREFFAICERTWREQPGPPLWLRFFKDDDQSQIYSAESLRALRRCIEEAARVAKSDIVRQRVAFVSAGFRITETFSGFCEARNRVGRMTRAPGADPVALVDAWKLYRQAGANFTRTYAEVRREAPLAINGQDLQIYLRHEPDSRVARELSRTESGRAQLRKSEYLAEVYLGATQAELSSVSRGGTEALIDPHWDTVMMRPVGSSATLEWSLGPIWRGGGEPWEGRKVTLDTAPNGQRVLRIASARTEQIGQWIQAAPGALYVAEVGVRAKSSAGTATMLVVNFLDANQRHIGIGRVDRLPAEKGEQSTSLCVIARAPTNARYIGFGLRIMNQINDDFAEFSGASLRRLAQ